MRNLAPTKMAASTNTGGGVEWCMYNACATLLNIKNGVDAASNYQKGCMTLRDHFSVLMRQTQHKEQENCSCMFYSPCSEQEDC